MLPVTEASGTPGCVASGVTLPLDTSRRQIRCRGLSYPPQVLGTSGPAPVGAEDHRYVEALAVETRNVIRRVHLTPVGPRRQELEYVPVRMLVSAHPFWLYITTCILTVSAKLLRWVGSSLEDLRGFPPEARRRAGYQLRRVQAGLMADDWKPMSTVGSGVQEIRVHVGTEYRIFHIAGFPEAIYVLHAFEKRTRVTRKRDIAIAKRRLAVLKVDRSRR